MELFFGWLIFSGVVAYIASSRGRLATDYFLLSVLLSPIIGLIILLAKSNLAEETKKLRLHREEQDRQIEVLEAIKKQESAVGSVRENTVASTQLIADELEKLANLRDKGLLTNEEFEARKTMLLR
jgi:ABC-type Na+ efflux pump permease subunit